MATCQACTLRASRRAPAIPADGTCDLKCAPCQPGKSCPALCDPLPLPPQCDQCAQRCKPCRPGAVCPKICVFVDTPPQCDNHGGDHCDPSECWMPPCPAGQSCIQVCQTPPWCRVEKREEISAEVVEKREEDVNADAGLKGDGDGYGDECVVKCKPCPPHKICSDICIPLPLPAHCNVEKPVINTKSGEECPCKSCGPGEFCPAVCIREC